MRIFTLIAFAGLLSLFSCQKYTLDSLPPDRLHFGNIGGYQGELREYFLLLDNGRILFKDPFSQEIKKIGRLDKEDLAEVRERITNIPFSGPTTRKGNINCVMSYHHDGEHEELQWQAPNGAPNESTTELFESLMAAVREMRKTTGDS